VISQTDALNRVTSYTYDAANRQTQITYPDNTTQSFTYDFRGNKLTETDQLGRVAKHVYDLAGQLTSTTSAYGTADAATASFTYDLDGRKLTQTDPRGNTTSYAYDAAGRQTSLTDGVGNLTSYAYDADSRRISITDAKQRITTYTYDARGRQLTATTPDSKTVTKTYDGLGNVLTVTDEDNLTIAYAYDVSNQLITVTDALNEVTQYGYDLSGNNTSQTDANGHTTQYVFDSLNRRTSRALPAGQIESFTYDAVSNKISCTDFNGRTTTLAYDSLNRLLSRTPDPFLNAAPITFTYTSTGKRASMTDPTGTTTYSYTNRDQVLNKATPQGTLGYAYDLSGNVSSVVSSNTNGTTVAYTWDADNRLASVTDNRTSGVTNYSYDQTSQVSTMQYAIGVAHAFSYDDRDRPINLNVTGPLGLSLSYTQTFDPSSHKLSVAEQSGRNTNYSYSSVYRLLSESIAGDPTSTNNGALSYVLDPVGNRLSLTATLAALSNQTFTYDPDDRLSSDTYDANGNTLTSGGNSFSYNFENRLTQFHASVQMSYDGDGNRVVRTASGSTTRYLVDDLTPTGYAQVSEEVTNGAVVAQYTYGSRRISQNRAGVLSYFGYDAGASVRQLFNDTGAVTDTYDYDAFGNTVAQTGSTINEFLYRGEQYDAPLEMYYLRARYYLPRTGRFLTQDTETGTAGKPITQHKYAYAYADPVNVLDPSGHGFFERAQLVILAVLASPAVQEAGEEARGWLSLGANSWLRANEYYDLFLRMQRSPGMKLWMAPTTRNSCYFNGPSKIIIESSR
jgi:RHS repeat-associated protein